MKTWYWMLSSKKSPTGKAATFKVKLPSDFVPAGVPVEKLPRRWFVVAGTTVELFEGTRMIAAHEAEPHVA